MKLIHYIALLFVLLPVIINIDKLKPLNNTTSLEKWYDKLPDCPCSYEDAKKLGVTTAPAGEWLDCGEANQDYHYGATYEFRWAPGEAGKPGQQCTYDNSGELITAGLAAGSPDKVSPRACGFFDGIMNFDIDTPTAHNDKDVEPWEIGGVPCAEYLANWPANNAQACKKNPVNDIRHMLNLVGDLTCEEVTLLFKMVKANSKNSDLKAFIFNKESKTPGNLKQLMQGLLVDLDCDDNMEEECKIVNKAIATL